MRCAQRCFTAAPPGNSTGRGPPVQQRSPLAAPRARPEQRPGARRCRSPATGRQPGCRATSVPLKPSGPGRTAGTHGHARCRPQAPLPRARGGRGQAGPAGPGPRSGELRPGLPWLRWQSTGAAARQPRQQQAPTALSVLSGCPRALRLLAAAKSDFRKPSALLLNHSRISLPCNRRLQFVHLTPTSILQNQNIPQITPRNRLFNPRDFFQPKQFYESVRLLCPEHRPQPPVQSVGVSTKEKPVTTCCVLGSGLVVL